MRYVVALLWAILGVAAYGQGLAPQPPMGWNSWDSYGLTIDEAQFRANVDVQVKVLKPFGYTYAVIDEGWFLPEPEALHSGRKVDYAIDSNGRYIPVPARFPSALVGWKNMGFTPLGEYVHSVGLRFGIHIVRGIPRIAADQNLPIAGSKFHAQDAANSADACPWDPTNYGVKDNAAGQAWYDSLVRQYAGWGVDFLKVDCVSDHPYKSAEVRMLHTAIARAGRPMVLSLSPGPASAGHVAELQKYAQMWRISDDIWDRWKAPNGAIYDQFPLAAGWVPFTHAGSWPDADMLPLGHLGPHPGDGTERETKLTHDEQRTLITLWAMARSPLIVGANLTALDPWTTALLTNREVLAIDQSSHNGMQQSRQYDMVAWTAEGAPGIYYLALFNLGDKPQTLARPFAFYGLPPAMAEAKELWTGESLPGGADVKVPISPHGVVLLRLKAE